MSTPDKRVKVEAQEETMHRELQKLKAAMDAEMAKNSQLNSQLIKERDQKKTLELDLKRSQEVLFEGGLEFTNDESKEEAMKRAKRQRVLSLKDADPVLVQFLANAAKREKMLKDNEAKLATASQDVRSKNDLLKNAGIMLCEAGVHVLSDEVFHCHAQASMSRARTVGNNNALVLAFGGPEKARRILKKFDVEDK